MTNSLKSIAIAAALLLGEPVLARGSVQANSPESAIFVASTTGSLSLPQIRNIIATAGASRGWRLVSEEAGKMTLYNNVRGKHEVTVRVEYDLKGFRIHYVSSVNMNHKLRGGMDYIHPKYNLWIDTLVQDILAKAALGPQAIG